ncbi:hypothetical protein D3C79_970290 [compost metagenome]
MLLSQCHHVDHFLPGAVFAVKPLHDIAWLRTNVRGDCADALVAVGREVVLGDTFANNVVGKHQAIIFGEQRRGLVDVDFQWP